MFSLKQHDRITDISAIHWDACTGDANPFIRHAFLSALEASGSVGLETGWAPHHLSFHSKEGRVEGVVPLYIKSHSYGEYVFDHGWAEAFESVGGSYYPKLQVCVPFSPIQGPRFLRHPQSSLSIKDMGEALQKIMVKNQMSSTHITFCTQEEWEQLGQSGWLQRTGIQFHWHNDGYKNFDGFLGNLTSSHRKSIRRERRDANAAGLIFHTLCGDEIKVHHWDAFYRFYLNTSDRKWGEAYLTREFFSHLSETIGDKIVLIMAFDDTTPIAGALNLRDDDTLYGRNWGCIGKWPFLHFELCYYRAIDFAIEHGLKHVEAGAQGEHKIQRGYLPQLTYSAHLLAHHGLTKAVDRFLDEERKIIDANMRHFSSFSPLR